MNIERSFTQKIKRENTWRWITAVLTLAICGVLMYGHLSLASDRGMLSTNNMWYVLFVQALILVLSTGVAWAMRDAQRHDLYAEVQRKSVMQLRRFRSEIDDEIERLEAENGQDPGQAESKKLRKVV